MGRRRPLIAGVPCSGVLPRFPGSRLTSSRRTNALADSGASGLAPLPDGSTAGELIPELVRHGLQKLIELEVAAVLGAYTQEGTEEHLRTPNDYSPRTLTTRVEDGDEGPTSLGPPTLHRLAPSPHQSEARLPADLLWVRSRRCAGPVIWGDGTSSRRLHWGLEPCAERKGRESGAWGGPALMAPMCRGQAMRTSACTCTCTCPSPCAKYC
jgi:hypothetical protein